MVICFPQKPKFCSVPSSYLFISLGEISSELSGEENQICGMDQRISDVVEGIGGSDGESGKIEWFDRVEGFKEKEDEIVGSVPMEWTDERHNSYLNSIEASFVDQLYNHDFNTNHLLGWSPRTQKDQGSSRPQTGNCYSGQFKVLRGGCWSEVKFERSLTSVDSQDETSALSRNPWIQHFSSNSTSEGFDLRAEETENCGELPCPNQFSSYSSRLCNEDSTRSSTEVSDQNFVDDLEGEHQVNGTHKKRNRTDEHQVAQCGKLLNANSPSCKENNSSDCSSTKVARIGWEGRHH